MKKPKTLTLDVSCWARKTYGAGANFESGLLNSQGNMCCLGQFCNQMSIEKEMMLDRDFPSQLNKRIPILTYHVKTGSLEDTNFSMDAISINDDSSTNDFVKIKKLRNLCKKNGIKLIVKNIGMAIK